KPLARWLELEKMTAAFDRRTLTDAGMCPRIDRGAGHDATSTTHARRAGAARHGTSHARVLHRRGIAPGPALQAQPRYAQRRAGAGVPAAPAARSPALALDGEPVRLRISLPLRHRARIG